VALIIRGSTRCAACGEVIEQGDEAWGLPHFTDEPSDPHYGFTDAGFHFACFDQLPERNEIIQRIHALDAEHGHAARFADRYPDLANPS
jgi:hypothetical protein